MVSDPTGDALALVSTSESQQKPQSRAQIRIENRENDEDIRVWAHSVVVDRCETVGDGAAAFVTWHVAITTWSGGRIEFWRRYSEFEMLKEALERDSSPKRSWVPNLPPKNISRFDKKQLDLRADGLHYFMMCVLLDPTRAHTGPVRTFCRRPQLRDNA